MKCSDCNTDAIFVTSWTASGCDFNDWECPKCKRNWTEAVPPATEQLDI